MSGIRIGFGLLLILVFQAVLAGAYEDTLEAIKRSNVGAINDLLKRGVDVNTSVLTSPASAAQVTKKVAIAAANVQY